MAKNNNVKSNDKEIKTVEKEPAVKPSKKEKGKVYFINNGFAFVQFKDGVKAYQNTGYKIGDIIEK